MPSTLTRREHLELDARDLAEMAATFERVHRDCMFWLRMGQIMRGRAATLAAERERLRAEVRLWLLEPASEAVH